MDDHDAQILAEHPQWQRVLDAYLLEAESKVERSEEETGPRWAQRVSQLDELESEELTGIHGQLIAMGWLKFQIEDRTCGMTYRISSSGRKVLKSVEKIKAELEESSEQATVEAAAAESADQPTESTLEENQASSRAA